jgi:hypothetical protein
MKLNNSVLFVVRLTIFSLSLVCVIISHSCCKNKLNIKFGNKVLSYFLCRTSKMSACPAFPISTFSQHSSGGITLTVKEAFFFFKYGFF